MTFDEHLSLSTVLHNVAMSRWEQALKEDYGEERDKLIAEHEILLKESRRHIAICKMINTRKMNKIFGYERKEGANVL